MSTRNNSPLGLLWAAASRTLEAATEVFRRPDATLVVVGTAVGYLLIYLYALGHLAPGIGGFDVTVVSGALRKFFQPELGPFSFTPVARVSVGPVTYLFSLNTVLGLGIASLVGLNLGLTYLAWRQPAACGIGSSSSGFLASIPAVLSGTACCGPVVLIVLGIQASGIIVTAFQFLLPIAVVLLLGSLILVGRQIDSARL
ncbi:hypothetical protein [Halobellus sp. H-GB7]|uniref:hypothetical protein n=1 Tax=Halobellus sp. H-GB7 TaxID=3069756 RepID=UPI0027B5E53A|nr:hypothetical protein [Halobellus sp. H-GB7]MDQ2055950.1 hypothetical protein [Halobellus sp. H-GB7]